MELLFQFLTRDLKLEPQDVAKVLWQDYQRGGRNDKPSFLKNLLPAGKPAPSSPRLCASAPKRQARYMAQRDSR
jgi:hypothetical protein